MAGQPDRPLAQDRRHVGGVEPPHRAGRSPGGGQVGAPQVAAGGGPRVAPREVVPRSQVRHPDLVETELRRAGLLLDDKKPTGLAPGLVLLQVEADEKAIVRVHHVTQAAEKIECRFA